MKALRRLSGLLRDSPTFGRDRANLMTGFSIGTAGLLLNGAVLIFVAPLMLDPDEPDFRALTENVEFGQLLALILLGGATAFATVLIPLRLVTVFWGPRTGRYFDQIVLSGISPLRFVIGKVTSQYLFLALILFLLLPYLVLSVTLGGVDPGVFLAGLFLVWLYCMALALVTLWISLYVNELLTAGLVIVSAIILSILGCIPMPIQPFVLTPFPALIHPVYRSLPFLDGRIPVNYLPVFASCAICLTGVIVVSLFAINLGPLFGIIRENSTFGEVVREGDSKRKRWFRLRLHIQRPSEVAFFYENRSREFVRHEGLIRWGAMFGGLLVLLSAAYFVFLYLASRVLARGAQVPAWWVYEFHTTSLVVFGSSLVLAIFLFSHGRNSTFLRLPFVRGRMVEVSRLDTRAFLLFLVVATAASITVPFYVDTYHASPNGTTLFPEFMYGTEGRPVDYLRITLEGSTVIACAGLVVYAIHRLACLLTWVKSLAFVLTAGSYFITVCVLPLFVAMLILEVPELRGTPILADGAPAVAMASPLTILMFLFNEMGSRFPRDVSTIPFYLTHGGLLGVTLFEIRKRGRQLRRLYFSESRSEVK